ncbi:MAG: hypothetical protein IKP77_04675 [Acholeplasmatales bacterium]|nr:hypothetical protein [Acholeplasmatales bacterium]
MKFNDYRRLAGISLKSRKKTTKTTVRGISFGLILIMPVLFIFMAFYIGLNQEVDKDKNLRTFNIGFSSNVTDQSNASFVSTKEFDNVLSINGVDEYVKYQKYIITSKNSSGEKKLNINVKYDGKEYNDIFMAENKINSYSDVSSSFIFYDVENSKNKNILLSNDNNAILAGKAFNENTKGEIMISSRLAEILNKNYDELIGKNISLDIGLMNGYSLTTSKTQRTEENEFNLYNGVYLPMFSNYKIIGVFNSEINNQTYRMNRSNPQDELIWFTYGSLYNDKDEANMGMPVSIEDDNGYYQTCYYYPSTNLASYSETATENGYVFLPVGAGIDMESMSYGNLYYKEYGLYLSFDSFSSANNATSIIDNYIKNTSTNEEKYLNTSYQSEMFYMYQIFYKVFMYLCIALAIFGGVIFFATLLNLYNTIEYSVQTRKNYLGLLRAIGMKNNSITKLYFVEILKTFTKSYIWTIIFGGLICFGIYFGFNMAMKTDAAKIITNIIKLELNPVYIPISFIILVVFDTIIALTFSLIACYKVSHKPLLEVLIDDK